jgi:predicted nucleic acid-binding protein
VASAASRRSSRKRWPSISSPRRSGGGLLCELRAAGAGIDIRDAMQAGICLHAGVPLVTRNIRHFATVPGLEVTEPERWRDGSG